MVKNIMKLQDALKKTLHPVKTANIIVTIYIIFPYTIIRITVLLFIINFFYLMFLYI